MLFYAALPLSAERPVRMAAVIQLVVPLAVFSTDQKFLQRILAPLL